MLNLGILGSTRGTTALGLMQAERSGDLKANIKLVLSDKKNALILEKAKRFGIPHQFINPENLNKSSFETELIKALKEAQVQLILLIGYMRILGPTFINAYRGHILNVHPSLLPSFAGLMNLQVHEAVLQAGDKISGCSIHQVNEIVDGG